MHKKTFESRCQTLATRIALAHGTDEATGRTLLALTLDRMADAVVAATNPPPAQATA